MPGPFEASRDPTTLEAMSRLTQTRRTAGQVIGLSGELLGILMQLFLMWVGFRIIFADDDAGDALRLFIWCLVSSTYLGATMLWLYVLVRLDQPDPKGLSLIVGHPVIRVLSTIMSFGASIIGFGVAVNLITELGNQTHDTFTEFNAVWAMLLSWALFNWGYARVYFSRCQRASKPQLRFAGEDEPRLADFVYFSFTNATTFATSDVQVLTTRMRWTVVWHTTTAFFFNALIIALTMNVIANGRLFAELFS